MSISGQGGPFFGRHEGVIVKGTLLLYLVLATIWHFSSNAPWDDDCVTRYYNALQVWENPKHFIALWNRPLFMLLFSIPLQITKHATLLMPVLVALGAYLLYSGMRIRKERLAFMVLPFLLFQSFFFPISFSNLAEPLAAILICGGYYFLSKRNFLAFAIVGSLLPLARLELAVLLLVWALILLKEKQLKYVWIFALPTILWSLAGTLIDGDAVWLYEQTIGKENESNRYGHTEFWHYFKRLIFVVGPIVFYFLFMGLLTAPLKRKASLFVHLQFLLGFMIYVIFSWKLNLGQAAGFLRHLVALSPLIAIIATQGLSAWIDAFGTPEAELKAEKALPMERKVSKDEVLKKRLAELEEKANMEGLKRRQVRHMASQIEKQVTEEFAVNESHSKKQEQESSSLASSPWVVAVISVLGIALIYFFSSYVLKNHHKLTDEPFYGNVMVMAGIFILFMLVNVFFSKIDRRLLVALVALVALGTIGHTIATEPPDSHNSPERKAMSRLTELVLENGYQEHDLYVNHGWFFWSSGLAREEAHFQGVHTDSLKHIPDSSVVIWENHYSTRLAGNVPMNHLMNDASFVHLFSVRSTDNVFNGMVFQKLPGITPEEKKQLYEQLTEAIPDEPSVHVIYGAFLAKQGNTEAALRKFDDALRIDKLNMDALHNKSLALMNTNRAAEAVDLLSGIVEVFPKVASMHYLLGMANGKLKKWPEAITAFTTAIELKKNYWEAYDNRGLAHFNQKNWNAAVQDYTKVLQLRPGNKGQAFYNRAAAFSNLKQKEKACADFKASEKAGFTNATKALAQYCK